jgi:hypothetical protein
VDARVKPARRTKRPGAGSRAFAFNFEAVFPSADQNMVQMYAKKVLLSPAFLPMPSIFAVAPSKFGPARILQADTEI